MNFSKLMLSAFGIFCFSLTYGQNKTSNSLENSSAFTAVSYSDVSESISSTKSHSLFITSNNLVFSNSVVKRFQVSALRSGHVKIMDEKSNIVATFFVEKGLNDVQFICPRGHYTLTSPDIDMKDPQYTN
jgi:hypothetical protein